MPMPAKKLTFLGAAFLAAALLSAPIMAEAATPPDDGGARTAPSGLSFRFDKDAFGAPGGQTTPEIGARQRFSRLAVRLYGGFSRAAAQDVNFGSDGYFEYFKMYEAMAPNITTTGGYSPVHAGYDLGADLIFQISRTFGIGLGVGYLRSARRSHMTLDVDNVTVLDLTATPTLSAMPVNLGLFLTVPVSRKINLTADARGTYFARFKFDLMQNLEFGSPDNWQRESLRGSRSSFFSNLGAQGSLGIEYKLSPRMGFFVEAVGRYARLKNFDVVTRTTEIETGGLTTDEGKAYIMFVETTDFSYSMFFVMDPSSPAEPPFFVREPKFDLSGFSVQTGIRIRF